jgi:hypothetical protein
MTGSTRLFNNKLNVTFGATFDPYATDPVKKVRVDKFLYRENGKLLRTTRAYINAGFSLQSKAGKKGSSGAEQDRITLDDMSTDKPIIENPAEDAMGYIQ